MKALNKTQLLKLHNQLMLAFSLLFISAIITSCGMIPGASYLGLTKEYIPSKGLTEGQRVCLYSRNGYGTNVSYTNNGVTLEDGDQGTVIGFSRTVCHGWDYTFVDVKFDKGITLTFGDNMDKWSLFEDNGVTCTGKFQSLQKCD